MKHRLTRAIVLAIAPVVAASSLAQTIKPGLWEIKNTMTSADPGTDRALSMLLQHAGRLPPEQRNMMEEMAAEQGLTMPEIAPDGKIGLTACVTPEMAAKRQIPAGQQGDCTSNNVPVVGGMKLSFTCANPPSSGEGKLSFIGDTGFTMAMKIRTSARGEPEQMTVDSTGRWLSATCPAVPR